MAKDKKLPPKRIDIRRIQMIPPETYKLLLAWVPPTEVGR